MMQEAPQSKYEEGYVEVNGVRVRLPRVRRLFASTPAPTIRLYSAARSNDRPAAGAMITVR